LQGILADLKPGDTADVTIMKGDGTQKTVKVTLSNLTG
jgi:hypothetical protein